MERCPLEIWYRIFAFACTDGGFTGRSLSCVSRSVREVSAPVKHQCVSLSGEDGIEAFCLASKDCPSPPRNVRSLFISTLEPKKQGSFNEQCNEEYYDDEADYPVEEGWTTSDSIRRILEEVAPTLTILDLHFTYSRPFFLPFVSLPQLVELSLFGPFHTINPYGCPCPEPSWPLNSLKRLRLAYFDRFPKKALASISQFAPKLTDLHIPAHPALNESHAFERALGLDDSGSDLTFPENLKRIWVETSWRLSSWEQYFVGELERMQAKEMALKNPAERKLLIKRNTTATWVVMGEFQAQICDEMKCDWTRKNGSWDWTQP